jgi:hypothetical protein
MFAWTRPNRTKSDRSMRFSGMRDRNFCFAGIFLRLLSFGLMKVARKTLLEPVADATFMTPKGYE